MEMARNHEAEQGQANRERPPPEPVMPSAPQDVVPRDVPEASGSAEPPAHPAVMNQESQRSEQPSIQDFEAMMNRVVERQIGELRTEFRASLMAQNKRISGLVKIDKFLDLNEVDTSPVQLEEEMMPSDA